MTVIRVRGRAGLDCADTSVATVRVLGEPGDVCAETAAVVANKPNAPTATMMIARVILAP